MVPPFISQNYISDWLEANDFHFFNWAEKLPNISTIENVSGALVRIVYKNGSQFEIVDELQYSPSTIRSQITVPYIKTLYKFTPRCLVSVVENWGAARKY